MRFFLLPALVASVALNGVFALAQQPQVDHYKALAMDFGMLSRYAEANAALGAPAAGEQRVVFFGDSITDSWKLDQYFTGKRYVNRGISGQTTPQMLVRFREDVVDLHAAVVAILAGTNDLAGLTGPETVEQIEANYATIGDVAREHGIKVVFASVLPVSSYGPSGQKMLMDRSPEKIKQLNVFLQKLCAANGFVFLDYYAAMVDSMGMLKRDISVDGLHPNAAGYAIMAPLAQKAINTMLAH